MKTDRRRQLTTRRRGVVAVTAVVMMVVLLGFAALAIDLGHLYLTKAELQRSADSAALAGAFTLVSDYMMLLQGPNSASYTGIVDAETTAWAAELASLNPVDGTAPVLQSADVVLGLFNFAQPANPLTLGGAVNAVQATVNFTSASANGPISHVFAPILGRTATDVTATAIAAFDDRFSGYTPTQAGPLIPFTIYVTEYQTQLVSGADDYEYDATLDVVLNFSDDIPEIKLFPYQTGGGDGAGNFGILNVGAPNQGVPILRDQIENGIPPADLQAEVGTAEMTFYDSTGSPVTYLITGNPGVKAGVESSVQARIGDLVGFFVHSQLVGGGAPATYTIVQIAFGRVMDVNLTGNPNNRYIAIQPVVYAGPEIQTDPNAPSSGGLIGRVSLVK